jgi:hypothetical protein
MHLPVIAAAGIVGIALSAQAPARPKPADDLGAVLDRIDNAATAFKSMSAIAAICACSSI